MRIERQSQGGGGSQAWVDRSGLLKHARVVNEVVDLNDLDPVGGRMARAYHHIFLQSQHC